jgi:hypothetical protein
VCDSGVDGVEPRLRDLAAVRTKYGTDAAHGPRVAGVARLSERSSLGRGGPFQDTADIAARRQPCHAITA